MSKLIFPGEAICISKGQIQTVPIKKWYWQYKTVLENKGQLLVFGFSKPWNWSSLELKNTAGKLPYKQHVIGVDENKIELSNVKVSLNRYGARLPYSITLDLVYKPSQNPDSWEHRCITLKQKDRISGDELELRGRVRPLLNNSGYFPTRIVVMAGDTHTGKSCFLYALQTRKVIGNLRRILGNGLFEKLNDEVYDVIPSTHPDEIHYYALYINNEVKHRADSVIFFIDLAGEVVRSNQDEKYDEADNDISSVKDSIRSSIAKYASALIVVTNRKAFYRGELPVAFLQELEHMDRRPEHICYVQTEADLLQQSLNDSSEQFIRQLLVDPNNKKDGLLAQALLKNPDHLREWKISKDSEVFKDTSRAADFKEAVFRHMAIAGNTMSDRFFTQGLSSDAPCFFVCSCQEMDALDGTKKLDFTKARNVELPVAYLVRQLVRL